MSKTAREKLVEAARLCFEKGLNSGTAGNLSLRLGDGMLITPTGIPPDYLQAEQMVEMDLSGRWSGSWKPSSEWAIHARIYQTTTASAVLHAHPDHCVSLSSLRKPLPPFHYMIASFGGNEVPCADYACFGTPGLAETVVAALGQTYNACLMANHGIVTIGPSLDKAVARAEKLEMLARQYLLARTGGEPVLLDEEAMAEVHARYSTYGQQ